MVARLSFAVSLALVIGAAGGAYATRALYGHQGGSSVDPSPERTVQCPPCPECPRCPPPTDCGEQGLIPRDPVPMADGPDPTEEIAPPKPGLPASAVSLASRAVQEAVAPCVRGPDLEGRSGLALLELTVTATGGQGFVSEVMITRRTGDAEMFEACLEAAARSARFVWEQSEGEAKFKLPVKIGP